MMKEIAFTSAALRQWARLAAEVRDRLRVRLSDYAESGRGDAKKLRGRAGVRLRVGDWRVVFLEDRDTITVIAVATAAKSTNEAAMNKVTFKKTDHGEIAILPRAEYERLRSLAEEAEEDAGTARLVAQARRAIAKGEEIIVPMEVADRLAAAENPIRVLRKFRELPQAELAVSIGITQGYLSDLENGKRKGPVALHQKIARKLGVPLDLLLPIAISEEEADPQRFANRRAAIARMRRDRRKR
jgi:mRNA-degrading endonuclease RelE of RelBE toxin-antitoxin system/DNA-binding XRE family transcriptional regulator